MHILTIKSPKLLFDAFHGGNDGRVAFNVNLDSLNCGNCTIFLKLQNSLFSESHVSATKENGRFGIPNTYRLYDRKSDTAVSTSHENDHIGRVDKYYVCARSM